MKIKSFSTIPILPNSLRKEKKFMVKNYLMKKKKQIYKASRNELVKTLNTRFNTEKTKAIIAAVKELRDKEK